MTLQETLDQIGFVVEDGQYVYYKDGPRIWVNFPTEPNGRYIFRGRVFTPCEEREVLGLVLDEMIHLHKRFEVEVENTRFKLKHLEFDRDNCREDLERLRRLINE